MVLPDYPQNHPTCNTYPGKKSALDELLFGRDCQCQWAMPTLCIEGSADVPRLPPSNFTTGTLDGKPTMPTRVLTVVSSTVGGFCQRAGIQIGSGQVNRSTSSGFGFSPWHLVPTMTMPGHYPASLFSSSVPILPTDGDKTSNNEPLLIAGGESISSPSLFSAKVGLTHLCNPVHHTKIGFSSVSLPCDETPPHEMDCKLTSGNEVCK
jgi:hypothetical protein